MLINQIFQSNIQSNIEVQKAPYLFPAERISCYSSDLMMRQYNRIKNMAQNGKKFSYKDLHRVHTIIFYENSSEWLKSMWDDRLYFHVGKTKFNTGIDIELLQDFHLISLDTFKEYRYPIYPELEDIVKDMNTYLIQPEERADKLEEEYKQEVARLKEEIEKLKQKN